jgi:murein DD-endopeptidase MepM/ murein hydrolase activator NlpD
MAPGPEGSAQAPLNDDVVSPAPGAAESRAKRARKRRSRPKPSEAVATATPAAPVVLPLPFPADATSTATRSADARAAVATRAASEASDEPADAPPQVEIAFDSRPTESVALVSGPSSPMRSEAMRQSRSITDAARPASRSEADGLDGRPSGSRAVPMRPAPLLARTPIPHRGLVDDGEANSPAGPSAAPAGRPGASPYLSPRMTAVFGGIFGLALVTSIIALLIQVVPPRDERAIAQSASSASAAPSASAPPVRLPKKRERTPLPSPWRISAIEKDASMTVVSGVMERMSFVDALTEKKIALPQIYRIMKAFDGVRKFDKSARKDRFTVAVDRAAKRVKAFEYEVSPSEIYQAREGDDGLLTGSKLDLKIASAEIDASFSVGSDLIASYKFAGLEDGLLGVLDEALSGHASTESFEEGAVVRAIVVEETALGLFSRYKQAVAVDYQPANPDAKRVRVYSFKGAQSRGYFDERGRQFGGGWRSPVPGAPVTSRFNPRRMHPVLHKIMPHQGTDYGAPTGAPIYAAFRGVVETAGPLGPCGNAVQILHANGVTTGYCHMSRFAAGLKAGDRVGTRQLIGYVGATGRATGPHLHFFAKRDGKFFDAQTLDLDGEHPVATEDRGAFLAAKAELDRRLDAIAQPEPPPEAPKAPPAPPEAATPTSSAAPRAAAPVATNVPLEDGGIHPGALREDDDEDDGEPLVPPATGTATPGKAP